MPEQNSKNFHRTHRPYKNRRRSNNEPSFNPNDFFKLYGDGDIPHGMEVALMDYRPIVHYATTITQAMGRVCSDIKKMGGNAAGYLTVEKGSVPKTSWSYAPARYEVSAYATLVLPVNHPPEEKEALITRFNTNIEYSEKIGKDLSWNPWKFLLYPFIIFPVALVLIALYSWLR